jgi:hypothetical protein
MTLTPEDISLIEALAAKNPVIAKLWEDWQEMNEDVTKQFAVALKHAVKKLNTDILSGDIRLIKEGETAAIVEVLSKSKQIVEGLNASNKILNGDDSELPKSEGQIPRKKN